MRRLPLRNVYFFSLNFSMQRRAGAANQSGTHADSWHNWQYTYRRHVLVHRAGVLC